MKDKFPIRFPHIHLLLKVYENIVEDLSIFEDVNNATLFLLDEDIIRLSQTSCLLHGVLLTKHF